MSTIKILIGDILTAEPSLNLPSKILSFIDDNNIHEREILKAFDNLMAFDFNIKGMVNVIFNIDTFSHTFYIDISSIIGVTREYKILDLNENINRTTNQKQLIAELARIERVFHQSDDKISWQNVFKIDSSDIFLVSMDSDLASKLLDFPEQNVLIKLGDFNNGYAVFDGIRKEVYHHNLSFS